MKQHLKQIVILTACALAWNAPAQNTAFTWKQTKTSLSLHNHGNMVWEHQHDRAVGKPCLRFGLLDGTELTRPVPMPDGYLNNDHVWHRGLWWSWKYINKINFWEENHAGTDPVSVKVETKEDGSARIELQIDYHLPDQPPLCKETRVIAFSAPDKSGSYTIDWKAAFTTAGEDDVVFNKNSYCGFSYRGAAEFSNNKKKDLAPWVFFDSEDRENKSNNQQAAWVGFKGKTLKGREAGIVIMDHPKNPRHPTWWQTRNNYPYFNPTLVCKEDYVLKPGAPLKLVYRVWVQDGPATSGDAKKAWHLFSREPF